MSCNNCLEYGDCLLDCYEDEETVFGDEEYNLGLDDDRYLWVPEFDDQ